MKKVPVDDFKLIGDKTNFTNLRNPLKYYG